MLWVAFGTGRTVTEIPEVGRDVAAGLIGELNGDRRDAAGAILGKASDRRGGAGDINLARDVGRAARPADRQRHVIKPWRAKSMRGIHFAAGIAITEIPGDIVDRAAGLVRKLNPERNIAGSLVLREGRDWTRDILRGRGDRRVDAVLHDNVIDDGRQERAVAQIDAQAKLVAAVLNGGRVPDAEQAIEDGGCHGRCGWEPQIAGVGVWPEFDLILEKLRVNGRAENLHVACDDIAKDGRQNDDAHRELRICRENHRRNAGRKNDRWDAGRKRDYRGGEAEGWQAGRLRYRDSRRNATGRGRRARRRERGLGGGSLGDLFLRRSASQITGAQDERSYQRQKDTASGRHSAPFLCK